MNDINWLPEPAEHDYPAAQDYLTLITTDVEAALLLSRLRHAKTVTKHAKDILRAVGCDGNPLSALLPRDNEHVAKQLDRIKHGQRISPVLLVVDVRRREVVIADGDHRVCAAYHHAEDAEVPCRIAVWE